MMTLHRYIFDRRRLYENRADAGRALARRLREDRIECDAVLGLTRGGVPVAFEVAAAYGAPLDVIVVKKLRAPMSQELAIGAICSDGAKVLHRHDFNLLDVSKEYLDTEVSVRLREAQAAESDYRGTRDPLDIMGKTVIVVDDGIATGATMEAALKSARRRGAARITAAVPVGPPSSIAHLSGWADDVVVLETPADFYAVGQFYEEFDPVQDDEVWRLLEANRKAIEEPAA